MIPTNNYSSHEAEEKWGCNSIAFESDYDYNEIDDEAEWHFWTKWRPPTLIYEKLKELFPDVFIYWRYEESGMNLYGYLNN